MASLSSLAFCLANWIRRCRFKGTLQAQALTGLPVQVAYSSPLRRARETADCIGCPVVEIPELAELDQGEWTGKSWAEIEGHWPNHAARKLEDWLGVPAPGGETWELFLARVETAWNRIRIGPDACRHRRAPRSECGSALLDGRPQPGRIHPADMER